MPFGTGIWEVLFLALFLLAYSIPAYVIGRRRRIPNSGVAFIPGVGAYIVLLRAARISAWWTFLILVPYLGTLVLIIWLAIVLPREHGRNRWWALPLIVLNFVAYWIYAFTLAEAPEGMDRADAGQTPLVPVATAPEVPQEATPVEAGALVRGLTTAEYDHVPTYVLTNWLAYWEGVAAGTEELTAGSGETIEMAPVEIAKLTKEIDAREAAR